MNIEKDKLILDFINKPYEVGEKVLFIGKGNGSKDLTVTRTGIISEILPDDKFLIINDSNDKLIKSINEIFKDYSHIGVNPFSDKKLPKFENECKGINYLLFNVGFEYNKKKFKTDCYYKGVDSVSFEPSVENEKGEEYDIQRGLVWSLEDKQNLIDSIYNNIDLGRLIFRLKSLDWCKKRLSLNKKSYLVEVIDGKQRLTTIIDFILDKFEDSYGNKFSDLSGDAQSRFINYGNISGSILSEDTTDIEVLELFLTVNHSGKPMSKEHIEYVKSIYKTFKK